MQPSKAMVHTRRLYQFERVFLHPERYPYINKERSLKYLVAMAEEVWAKYGRKRVPMPRIEFKEAPISYCLGYSEIYLVKGQRNIEVLLHELVHAMGYGYHNKAFAKKLLTLLVEFGKCEEGKLILEMGIAGVV